MALLLRIHFLLNYTYIGLKNISINTDYISFLDADDFWSASKISNQVELINSKNIDFVYRSSNTGTTPKLRFVVGQTNPQIHSSIFDGHIEFFRDANGTPTKYLTLSSNSTNSSGRKVFPLLIFIIFQITFFPLI